MPKGSFLSWHGSFSILHIIIFFLTASDKLVNVRGDNKESFFLFSAKTYFVGTHWNGLIEVVPVITHKICFGAK